MPLHHIPQSTHSSESNKPVNNQHPMYSDLLIAEDSQKQESKICKGATGYRGWLLLYKYSAYWRDHAGTCQLIVVSPTSSRMHEAVPSCLGHSRLPDLKMRERFAQVSFTQCMIAISYGKAAEVVIVYHLGPVGYLNWPGEIHCCPWCVIVALVRFFIVVAPMIPSHEVIAGVSLQYFIVEIDTLLLYCEQDLVVGHCHRC